MQHSRDPGRVFVIAEAGVNHNGSVSLAHSLVDVAADCGADAVKFQTFEVEGLVAPGAPTAQYQTDRTSSTSQSEMLRSLVLPDPAWVELRDHATDRGIEFMSTAFDLRSADRLVALGVSRLKVPSGEITNTPFIRALAGFGLPLIISTGTADLDEVAAAVAAAGANVGLSLMHCVSAYPAPVETANLRAIATMRARFDVPVGWSDHTSSDVSAICAVALGATIVEKHVTLDRGLSGPDHTASADPDTFGSYVVRIRTAERALGTGVKSAHAVEADTARVARRSWFSARDLAPGALVTSDDLVALRPGTGISPSVDLVGRRVARGVPAGTMLRETDVDPSA